MHYAEHRESDYVTVNVTYSSTTCIESVIVTNNGVFQPKSDLCAAEIWAKPRRVESFWSHALSRNSEVL